MEPWLENDHPWKHWERSDTVQVQCATLEENEYHCDSGPCENGRCIGVINDFYCLCDLNWNGKTCNNQGKTKLMTEPGISIGKVEIFILFHISTR